MEATETDTTIDGLINWVDTFKPLPNMKPYAGECAHQLASPVAFGWDNLHHQLVECLPCGSRAWVGIEKEICGCLTCRTKPAVLRVSTPWMQSTK